MLQYKLVLVGDGGVGKTSLIRRLINGEFTKEYVPTIGKEVNVMIFNTNYGPIRFNIWEISGQEKYSGLDAYAFGADAIMGICDLTSKISANNLSMWYDKVKSHIPINSLDLPSVVCGNKYDIHSSRHKVSEVDKMNMWSKWGIYYDIIVKTNYNIQKPFLYLVGVLTGYNDLVFIPHPPITSPTVNPPTVN